MKSKFRRLPTALKALRELGFTQVGLYTWYQLALRSGFLRWQTRKPAHPGRGAGPASFRGLLAMPSRSELSTVLGSNAAELLAEADEIVAGQVRLFGGPPVPLRLTVPGPLAHWTAYEHGPEAGAQGDVKFTWEPGRFGWAYTLARAYLLSGDERYPESFWRNAEAFLDANPPYCGPHWASAQEVALRLIACTFALQALAASPSSAPERVDWLTSALAAHAQRLPPTLVYARAQNNNHLLVEAAGLYTAGICLPDHPAAPGWRALGWRWFHTGLQTQIAEDGTYVQHSANYHRLMLQAALWIFSSGEVFPPASCLRLAAGTRWLLAIQDPESGRVPNLGPNDGAYILPLSTGSFQDFRPVLQAAAQAFLGKRAFKNGPWDEMSLWLGNKGKGIREESKVKSNDPPALNALPLAPHILHSPQKRSWAYLRVARFTSRPGHADQLHLDLWWRGINVAQDAGTYLYNAKPPWDNSLARTDVHNTLTLNGQDQMTRAGRFLWLDWAQGQLIDQERAPDGSLQRLVAQHEGYRRFGALHRRSVISSQEGRWLVEDAVLPVAGSRLESPFAQADLDDSIPNKKPVLARLHWLLPDWPWEVLDERDSKNIMIRVRSHYGWIELKVTSAHGGNVPFLHTLSRAGELLSGSGPVSPTWGWVAHTYGSKIPALSFAVEVEAIPPLSLSSEWIFPEGDSQ